MVFRWDPCGLVCIVLVYGCVAYADYVAVVWLILPTFDGSLLTVIHTCVFNALLAMLCAAHARAMCTDPGMVEINRPTHDDEHVELNNGVAVPIDATEPKRHDEAVISESSDSDDEHRPRLGRHADLRDVRDVVQAQARSLLQSTYATRAGSRPRPHPHAAVGDDWTLCGRCDSYRPPRAHHCRICKRCIRKMDHHCPWVNNCVGEDNQKYFMQFLLYVGLASVYCLMLVFCAWYYPCAEPPCPSLKHDPRTHHSKVLHTIFVSIECVLFCLFVVAVSCDQLQAVFNDETAVEQVQRRGTFDTRKTRKQLMRDVCGRGPTVCWLLPCSEPPTYRPPLPPTRHPYTV